MGLRLWLFRLIAVFAAPLLLVVLLEAGLRAVGYGYSPSAAMACEVNGVPHRGDNQSFGLRFFPTTLAREFEPFAFPAKKPAGTYRIFVLGASAAQGVPNHAFRFGRILETMLQERFPQTRFEVVTAAMAAINSHVILEIARDCARYEPDMFVAYFGNNEVVGPYGPGTVLTPALSNLHLIRLGIAVKKTRVGQLLSNAAQRLGRSDRGPEYWQGMEMFIGQEVRADDPRLNTVYSHFRRNVEDICQIAAGAGAQAILCTVGVNLRDCPPFASSHKTGLTLEQQGRWEQLYRQGVQYEAQGDHAAAAQSYNRAAGIDATYAELQFRLGRCHWQLGGYDKAAECFARARDFDVLRFRADARINEIIRSVAQQRAGQGVWLADAAAALAENSPHGLPGEELFYEHVHLTFEGNYLLARTVYDRLEPILVERFQDAPQGEPPTPERCARRLMYSDWSLRESLSTIVNAFLSKPPFTNQLDHSARVDALRRRLAALEQGLTPDVLRAIAERYRAVIAQAPEDWRLRRDYGKLLAEDLKQYDAAVEQYRVVQGLLPHSYTGYDALGAVLRAKGDYARAIAEYRKTLSIKPTAGETYYHLGFCLSRQGKVDAARDAYRKAMRFAPNCIPAYLGLGELLFREGKLNEAIEVCRAGMVVAPNHAQLHSNVGMLLIRTGQRQAGEKEIRIALQLDPNSPQIRRVAETLLGPGAAR